MNTLRVSALFGGGEVWLPRFRDLGDLTLDLFHHDGRVEDCWLALEPAEFELLWLLAKEPSHCVPEQALPEWVRDRRDADLTLARLSAKLAAHRLGHVLACHAEGCVCFAPSGGEPAPT